jgi:hypothetical protein
MSGEREMEALSCLGIVRLRGALVIDISIRLTQIRKELLIKKKEHGQMCAHYKGMG